MASPKGRDKVGSLDKLSKAKQHKEVGRVPTLEEVKYQQNKSLLSQQSQNKSAKRSSAAATTSQFLKFYHHELKSQRVKNFGKYKNDYGCQTQQDYERQDFQDEISGRDGSQNVLRVTEQREKLNFSNNSVNMSEAFRKELIESLRAKSPIASAMKGDVDNFEEISFKNLQVDQQPKTQKSSKRNLALPLNKELHIVSIQDKIAKLQTPQQNQSKAFTTAVFPTQKAEAPTIQFANHNQSQTNTRKQPRQRVKTLLNGDRASNPLQTEQVNDRNYSLNHNETEIEDIIIRDTKKRPLFNQFKRNSQAPHFQTGQPSVHSVFQQQESIENKSRLPYEPVIMEQSIPYDSDGQQNNSAFMSQREVTAGQESEHRQNSYQNSFIRTEDFWVEIPQEYNGLLTNNLEFQLQLLQKRKRQTEKKLNRKIYRARKKFLFSQEESSEKGWLELQQGKKWKRKNCVLKDKKMKFYSDVKHKQLDGTLDFDFLTVRVNFDFGALSFTIHVLFSKNVSFTFRCESAERLTQWLKTLNANIEGSIGNQIDMVKVSIQPQFWKTERICENYFNFIADSGDILLFEGMGCVSRTNQFLIGSKYDHVAMCQRYASGNLVVFEATGLTGVSLIDWKDFLKYRWHTQYKRIVYRKLNFERSSSNLKKLEDFVKSTLGKPYKIKYNAIVCQRKPQPYHKTKNEMKKSYILPEQVSEGESSCEEQEKYVRMRRQLEMGKENFYCSELVFAALQVMGLVAPDIEPGSVTPGCFDQKRSERDIRWVAEASLSPEQEIDFSIQRSN